MRIIAGQCRGRLLKTLRGRALRPTSDRLRETLFNILGAAVSGAVFIDCYAGSGAVGLEALSRGAGEVFLIEADPAAQRLIRQNADALGAGTALRLVPMQVSRGLRKLEEQGARAQFCFFDPPYALLQEALRSVVWLVTSSLMLPHGLIIVEHSRRDATPEHAGSWMRVRLLQQGSSALSFYRKGQEG
jgi:16S rRNA (guanine(966)-N(2))-methyltransferase RsmD